MNKQDDEYSGGFKLFSRVAALRRDESGSLTLLASMMIFMAAIFGIIAFDTNKAIYNRIQAQNSADAAAETAALWQARGCNLLQQLNNLHYNVNKAACTAETAAGVSCVLADGAMFTQAALLGSLFGAPFAPIAAAARWTFCTVCDQLPYIDNYQNVFYNSVLTAQDGVVKVTPYVAFGYANAAAQGNGADPINSQTLLQFVASAVGQIIPSLGETIASSANNGASSVGGLDKISLYAVPLDINDFGLIDPAHKGLYVMQKANDGHTPLAWPSWVGEGGETAGLIGCSRASATPPLFIPGTVLAGPPGFGYFDDADRYHDSHPKSGPGKKPWGWNDNYYFGWPGFSTWVAWKTGRDELLSLGDLAWLNGGRKNPNVSQNADEVSRALYTDPVRIGTGSQPLKIPTFIAIASSQVEGDPVIEHGDANARGTLIKVYIPNGSSPTSGETYFMYH